MENQESRQNQRNKVSPWILRIALLSLAAAAVIWGCFAVQSASGSQRSYPVRINEILASNTSYPNEDGLCCDYIELYNEGAIPVNLTGFQLGDVAGGTRYAIPAGTVLEAGEYLVIYCDKNADNPAYANFGISRSGGEEICLIASNHAVVDRVITLALEPDQSMILLDNGSWMTSDDLTPGKANAETGTEMGNFYNPTLSAVRISEFSALETGFDPKTGTLCDWVELYNTGSSDADISGFTLSDNIGNDKFRFPEGTVIPGNGYLITYCSDLQKEMHLAPFSLSRRGGEQLVLKNSSGKIVEIVETLAMDLGSQCLTEQGWELSELPSPGFENTRDGCEMAMRTLGADPGRVQISEVMAASQLILPDAMGEFSDWVELYNGGETAVSLAGWTLSDDPEEPGKWQFPDVEIQPGERKILFCSGHDGLIDGQLHADFSLSAGGEHLVLRSFLGIAVDEVVFGASEKNCSLVMENGEAVVTQYPTPGFSNNDMGYELFCQSQTPKGPLAIWEVMTANDWYLPQQLGECYDWVEIRNVSDETVHLADYCITEDPEFPQMYVLPEQDLEPGEEIVIILSGDETLSGSRFSHAGFSLSAVESQLLLFAKDGKLLDYVHMGKIPAGQSYGRREDSGGFYYMEPSPQNPNRAGFRLISSEPTSRYEPGVYSGEEAFEVALEADGVIYYTTDGSDPDPDSRRYEGPVKIEETTVLRAISLEEGRQQSGIYTATFVVNQPHTIPVVSLTTDPDHLWGYDGVYRKGDESLKEIRFPANVAYSGDDGSFSIDCEMNLHGESTVIAFDKKSFAVRFLDNYDGPLHYDVFEDGEVTDFHSLLIRTSHESTYSTQMHDAFISEVASENCDTLITQKNKFVALYLNGEYWGLYTIREHHSPEHYASYMHVPASSVTICRYCTRGSYGLDDFYWFLGNNTLKSEENYAYAQSILDMSSYVDWLIMEAYMSNIDINGNMRYYYSSVDQIWRCGLVDVDLGIVGAKQNFPLVSKAWLHGRLMRGLLTNADFRELLATRMAELLAGPMSDENMIARVDAMAAEIRDEARYEQERWGTPVSGWEVYVDDMRWFCDGRVREMIDGLCEQARFSNAEREKYFGELLD